MLDQRKACHKAMPYFRQNFLPWKISDYLWVNDLKLPLALGRKIGCLIWFDSLNYHAKWEILVVKDEHSSLNQDLRSLQRLRLLGPPGAGSLSKQLAHGKTLEIQTQIPVALCDQNNSRHGLGAHPGSVQPVQKKGGRHQEKGGWHSCAWAPWTDSLGCSQRLSKINVLLRETRYLSHKSPLSPPCTFPSL